ncbi:PA-phosphatase [Brevundimonas sp.]|uniref:PA-phosphatase n=1 Tax=Brevundimonas sp. TaxID=1871086 RepID=UPI002AB8656B|nr:PA-phosphatase [Brevundimonas sp.]MDZ4363183.1 PA-phosphatase [Brevundimonas sp.]
MNRAGRAAGAVAAACLLILSSACTTTRPVTPAAALAGYLPAPANISAGPAPGEPSSADRQQSLALSGLADTDRWFMATAHAELSPTLAVQHFDCRLGTRIEAVPTPALDRLMTRLATDVMARITALRRAEGRAGPVAMDPARRSCVRLSASRRAQSSWPSGAAALGVAYGEALALLAPDRADAVRGMGAAIGDSAAICGLAWPSDVAAGAEVGRTVFAQAAATPDFIADAQAARAEIAAARASGLTNPGCAAERRALGLS